ncbi:MAG: helix-turn-helix domain-containing protein [Rikenellaceae bacterium]
MKETEKIEKFLESKLATRKDNDLAECLKAWEVGSPEWEEGAMMLFVEELLYPLSQVVEYLRRGKRIGEYIELIPLIKEVEMVRREEMFNYLRELKTTDAEGVERVLYSIYGDEGSWDLIDCSLTRDDRKAFEELMGSGEKAANLKKIVCHYRSIMESRTPLYRGGESPCLVEYEEPSAKSLEELKVAAKKILSLCAKLMLPAKEESYIKQICKNPIIEQTLSFEALRYYYRVRDKKAATITEKTEVEATPIEPQPSPEYYTKEEVMKLFDVSNTTLYNWNIDGTLQHHKIGRKV